MFKLEVIPSEKFHTKYGKIKINRDGYCEISGVKEGNKGKMLHRLIWEEYYGAIPKKTHIHHIDGNPLNNCIWNLEPINESEHLRMHKTGKILPKELCYAISKSQNTTGYYRVHKQNAPSCKQGFLYVYQYRINGKRRTIKRVNLNELKKEVEMRGLKWSKIEELG